MKDTGTLSLETTRLERRKSLSNESAYELYEHSVLGGYKFNPKINYKASGLIGDVDRKTNKATTLLASINVLSYTPSLNRSRFCHSATGIDGKGCPMSSVPWNGLDNLYLRDLPNFRIVQPLNASYAFSSLSSSFKIISGDARESSIGCIQVEITPGLGRRVSAVLRFVPLGILILVGFGTVVAAILNPWNGTTDIFRWSSNYGMDQDMLRLVTPGFGDCLQYLQFAVLAGALTLNYPGFFQPALSQVAWSVLLFNSSVVSRNSHTRLIDNVYAPNGTYGFENLSQLVGLGGVNDVWPIATIVSVGILGGACFCIEASSWLRWAKMRISKQQEEDLRSKKLPFIGGMAVRIVFNYCLHPLVAFSAFQLIVAKNSPIVCSIIAALLLVGIVACSGFCLHRVKAAKPRHALFDQLETLLLLGPLYNTYEEKSALYAIVQMTVNIARGIAFGAAQHSGIAQLVLLAVCEVVLILTLVASRPYSPRTSMNLYNTFFASIRLLTILFSVAFVPSMAVDDSTKGWIGYVVLFMHGIVLVFGFFLNAVQTVVEVFLRLAGVGDSGGGASRGALVQVFGMRQLSRRTDRGNPEPFSDVDTPTPGTHERKLSALAGSDRLPLSHMDSGSPFPRGHSRTMSASTVLTPGSPQAPGPTHYHSSSQSAAISGLGITTAGLSAPNLSADAANYYRAPRAKPAGFTPTAADTYSPGARSRESWGSNEWNIQQAGASGSSKSPAIARSAGAKRSSYGGSRNGDELHANADDWDSPTAINTTRHSGTLSPPMSSHGIGESTSRQPMTDFSVREVDQVYGLRGEPLSHQPSRRLRTGPADPTGPVAAAKGWLKKALGRKPERKGTFEVVRSARRPDMLLEMQAASSAARTEEGAPPELTGLAANQDQDSSDEDSQHPEQQRSANKARQAFADTDSDNDDGEGFPTESGSVPQIDPSTSKVPEILVPMDDHSLPSIPRKSSKRRSRAYSTQTEAHSRTASNASSLLAAGSQDSSGANRTGRPASVGNVQRHRIDESLRVPVAEFPYHSSAEFVGNASDKSDTSTEEKK